MPHTKIWLHCVWSTKHRGPFLKKEIRDLLLKHILSYSKTKNIYIDKIGGFDEHIHCLLSLGNDQTISKVINILRGESSHWLNEQKLLDERFDWQDDYFAVSISESILNDVRNYIDNQETHHTKKSYKEEVEEIIKKYGFKIICEN